MGKIVHYVHQSLDGFINGPNGEFDWPAMGPELSAYSLGMTEHVGAFLYGRRVWEMMSYFWPRAESMSDDPHDLAFAPIWRRTPKVVLSRTLERAEGARVIGADLAGQVGALKRESDGDLLLTGGSGVAAALTELGLVDEYRIVVHPVVLGGGTPLWRTPKQRINLELVGSRTFDDRSVLLCHRPAG